MKNLIGSIVESQNPPWHEAANADESIGDAYRRLVSLKFGFDRMKEIPQQYQSLYKEIGTAIDVLVKARSHSAQIREMVKRSMK